MYNKTFLLFIYFVTFTGIFESKVYSENNNFISKEYPDSIGQLMNQTLAADTSSQIIRIVKERFLRENENIDKVILLDIVTIKNWYSFRTGFFVLAYGICKKNNYCEIYCLF